MRKKNKTDIAINNECENNLIEVYKVMWERIGHIDRIDMSYIAIPPTIIGIIITWLKVISSSETSNLLNLSTNTHLIQILSIGVQCLIGVTALILLRNYIDYYRAISNIAAVEEALGIDKYLSKRLSKTDSNNRWKLFFRLLRSNKGILFIFYNLLIIGIAVVFNYCSNYIAAAILLIINFVYIFYYLSIYPSEGKKNK